MDFSGSSTKAWRDIWGAGQSVSGIDSVESVQDIITQLVLEFTQAKNKLCELP
jgi:nitronate monooxygenase